MRVCGGWQDCASESAIVLPLLLAERRERFSARFSLFPIRPSTALVPGARDMAENCRFASLCFYCGMCRRILGGHDNEACLIDKKPI